MALQAIATTHSSVTNSQNPNQYSSDVLFPDEPVEVPVTWMWSLSVCIVPGGLPNTAPSWESSRYQKKRPSAEPTACNAYSPPSSRIQHNPRSRLRHAPSAIEAPSYVSMPVSPFNVS